MTAIGCGKFMMEAWALHWVGRHLERWAKAINSVTLTHFTNFGSRIFLYLAKCGSSVPREKSEGEPRGDENGRERENGERVVAWRSLSTRQRVILCITPFTLHHQGCIRILGELLGVILAENDGMLI